MNVYYVDYYVPDGRDQWEGDHKQYLVSADSPDEVPAKLDALLGRVHEEGDYDIELLEVVSEHQDVVVLPSIHRYG